MHSTGKLKGAPQQGRRKRTQAATPATRTSVRAVLGSLGGALPLAVLLAGCGTTYTVDDGSAVDEKLLANIRTYGKGQQALRPSIVKSAELKDKDCSTQYELPFVTASSYDLPKQKKIAWVRGLRVDERLTVIAATRESGLQLGEHIEKVDGYSKADTRKMLEELNSLRDSGDPFKVTLAGGRDVLIKPVEVCRGRVLVAAPEAEVPQEYHWLQSTHPLSLFSQDVKQDEAMWMVLWTQGLSEEAGARMKVYHYGLKIVKAGITIASIASGVGAVANAASTANAAAAAAASAQAGRAATQAALQAAAKVAAEQAANTLREKALDTAQMVVRGQIQALALDSLKAASIFKDSLSGVSWVAGTGFYMADKWAYERMEKLGGDPLSAFTLHYKLASNAQAQNAFVFDEERLKLMGGFSDNGGLSEKVQLVLAGQDPDAPVAYAVVNMLDPRGTMTYVAHDAQPATSGEAAAAASADATPVRVVAGDSVLEGAFALDANQTTYSGNGKVSWTHGDVYVGNLMSGYRTGSGRMEWANGDRYDGQWKDNLRHGKGTITWKNGDSWTGTFKEDVQTEDGVLTRRPTAPIAAEEKKPAEA